MEGYGAKTYGDGIAEVYDHLQVGRHDTDACVELLAGLAGEGPVLELGVGTGRVALPLAARGLQVHGIDLSEARVERLRANVVEAFVPDPARLAQRQELTVDDVGLDHKVRSGRSAAGQDDQADRFAWAWWMGDGRLGDPHGTQASAGARAAAALGAAGGPGPRPHVNRGGHRRLGPGYCGNGA